MVSIYIIFVVGSLIHTEMCRTYRNVHVKCIVRWFCCAYKNLIFSYRFDNNFIYPRARVCDKLQWRWKCTRIYLISSKKMKKNEMISWSREMRSRGFQDDRIRVIMMLTATITNTAVVIVVAAAAAANVSALHNWMRVKVKFQTWKIQHTHEIVRCTEMNC